MIAGHLPRARPGLRRPMADRTTPRAAVRSIESIPGVNLLPTVLGMLAGSVDAISFLGLADLFAAHASGGAAPAVPMLSVPVFLAAVGLTRLLVAVLERLGFPSLGPLLSPQFLLLAGFLAVCGSVGPPIDSDASKAILAGMLGVSAMVAQDDLLQISLKQASSTAVMIRNRVDACKAAGGRARRIGPAIVGFAAGCALGAACEAAIGPRSLALPAALAPLALVTGLAAEPSSDPPS